jgi:hypothetical protein
LGKEERVLIVHPAQMAKWGLRDETDVRFSNGFLHEAARLFIPKAVTEAALDFYGRELAPQFAQGRIDGESGANLLFDRLADAGIAPKTLQSLTSWHTRTAADFAKDGTLPSPVTIGPATVVAERAEIERIMRDDPRRYWGDEAMQYRLAELIEQTTPADMPTVLAGDPQRRGELERMMGDQRSPYWSGPQSASLQSEYRSLVQPSGNETDAGGGTGVFPQALPTE